MKRERISLKDRLDNVDNQALQAANVRLHELCSQYNLTSWKVTDKNGLWRELGLRMSGIPARELKSRGRPKKFSSDFLLKFYELHEELKMFVSLDKNACTETKVLKKSIAADIAKSLKLKDRQVSTRLSLALKLGDENKAQEDKERDGENWDEPIASPRHFHKK